jgi:hypothetical protein
MDQLVLKDLHMGSELIEFEGLEQLLLVLPAAVNYLLM